MESEAATTVVGGPLRVRPAIGGNSFLLVVVGLVWLISSATYLAPLITVAALVILDGVLSMRRAHRHEVTAQIVKTVVTPPEVITVHVDVSPSDREIIVPLGFAFNDVYEERQYHTANDESWVELKYPPGQPATHRFARFVIWTSTLGFVQVWRPYLAVSSGLICRGPMAAPNELQIQGIDEVARLREYVTGDRLSRVSWPSTARTGSLFVRDAEVNELTEVVVVVDLGLRDDLVSDPGAGFSSVNHALSVAAGVCSDVLASGRVLSLVTTELDVRYFDDECEKFVADPSNPQLANSFDYPQQLRSDVVTDLDQLAVRLAQAEIGPVDYPPPPFVLVTGDGAKLIS